MHLRVFRIDRVLLKCRLVFSTEAGHGSPDEPDGPTVSCCGVSCSSAVWLYLRGLLSGSCLLAAAFWASCWLWAFGFTVVCGGI